MFKAQSARRPSTRSVIEPLEGRTLYSAAFAPAALAPAAAKVKLAATKTTISATAGTVGQPVSFAVRVRAATSAGSPTGTVTILDHGTAIATLTLEADFTPGVKGVLASGNYDYASATYTEVPAVGGVAYYTGKHAVTAKFTPTGAFAKSAAAGTFTVAKPTFTTVTGGVGIDTIAAGSGAAITTGQTAAVLYTGYLYKGGKVFDYSSKDGGTPLTFAVGTTDLIAGFSDGVTGMQVGESRLVLIPPAEGYGTKGYGPVPGNASIVFEMTLESIS